MKNVMQERSLTHWDSFHFKNLYIIYIYIYIFIGSQFFFFTLTVVTTFPWQALLSTCSHVTFALKGEGTLRVVRTRNGSGNNLSRIYQTAFKVTVKVFPSFVLELMVRFFWLYHKQVVNSKLDYGAFLNGNGISTSS